MKTQLLILLLLSTTLTYAQSVKVHGPENVKIETTVGYNFFIGQDAGDFRSSIDGFGSGLIDPFAGRSSFELFGIGTDNVYLSLGLGLNVSKFRFTENLLLDLENGVTTWAPDPDETHDYINTFFGYGKTKLVYSSFYAPLDLNIKFSENLVASVGVFADYVWYAKWKSKYMVDDEKVKELTKTSAMKDYNLNLFKYGVNANIYHKKLEMGLGFTYYLTPFFQNDMGPELQECRISLIQSMGTFKELAKDF